MFASKLHIIIFKKNLHSLLKKMFFKSCFLILQIAELDLTKEAYAASAPIVFIQAIKKGGDPMALQRMLIEHMPNNIILYANDIGIVRQLEVYQNNNPSLDLKVYFLIYGGSVEEQEYLTSLRREKEAFHSLISTKTVSISIYDLRTKIICY